MENDPYERIAALLAPFAAVLEAGEVIRVEGGFETSPPTVTFSRGPGGGLRDRACEEPLLVGVALAARCRDALLELRTPDATWTWITLTVYPDGSYRFGAS